MDESTSKTCVRCGEGKPVGEFHNRTKSRDGLNPACKDCLRDDRRKRRSMTAEDRRREREAIANRTAKVCGKCEIEKPREDFSGRSRSHDGLAPWCKVCASAYSRQHYLANKDRVAARADARYLANKELRNAQQRAWYEANRERNYANSRRWIAANAERHREFFRRRRAVLAQTTVGPVDLDALWTGRCGICSGDLDRTLSHPHPFSKSIDHIVPLSRGGTHTQDNLQWAHLRCNISKGARLIT